MGLEVALKSVEGRSTLDGDYANRLNYEFVKEVGNMFSIKIIVFNINLNRSVINRILFFV